MYRPQPIPTGEIVLPESLFALSERLAEHNHDVWAKRRLAEGWRFGPHRSDDDRTHPDLVSYAELPDSEKEYDRSTVFETLKAIIALGIASSHLPAEFMGIPPIKAVRTPLDGWIN